MRNRKKKGPKGDKSPGRGLNALNHDTKNTAKDKTKELAKENGKRNKYQVKTEQTVDHRMQNGTTTVNGTAHQEDSDNENGHLHQSVYMLRRHSIAAAQQLSVDLAQNSHTFLRYGTYATLVAAFLLVFPHYFTIILRPNLPPIMDGYVAPGFEKVAETFK